MPLRTVEIELSELEWYVPGARFMAELAYPDERDKSQRVLFFQSLVKLTLFSWMHISPEWRNNLQLIRPAYLSGADKLHNAIIRRGNKRISERIAVANFMVIPHLKALETGRLRPVRGLDPTVN